MHVSKSHAASRYKGIQHITSYQTVQTITVTNQVTVQSIAVLMHIPELEIHQLRHYILSSNRQIINDHSINTTRSCK